LWYVWAIKKRTGEFKMEVENPIFYQLFENESSTYTYLLVDAQSKEAVIIDPVLETVDRDLKLIEELGAKLIYILDTHVHADHITGAGKLRERTGAKSAVSEMAKVNCVDIPLSDGQNLTFGKHTIKALSTPGHTDSCMSFIIGERVFTGDVLLIRGTGRTDFQQGSSEKMYQSITKKIFTLPDHYKIYPGHDYRGHTVSTVGMEKKFNPRIGGGQSLQDFTKTMSELKLAYPKKIHEALPANLGCGLKLKDDRVFHPQLADGTPEVSVEDVHLNLGKVRLIDVRGLDEWGGELGHIEGSELITMGTDLDQFLQTADKNQEIVFVCRSGNRSGMVTRQAQMLGFKKSINMSGGMMAWNQIGYPVAKNA